MYRNHPLPCSSRSVSLGDLCGQDIVQGEFIPFRSEASDYAARKIREIRLFAKRLAREDVGKMNFNERNSGRRKRIPQRNASVGKSGRINDDKAGLVPARALNTIDQLGFSITLKVR